MSTKNSIKIVCKHCGNIFDKPYWRLKQAIAKKIKKYVRKRGVG